MAIFDDILYEMRRLLEDAKELKDMKVEINKDYSASDIDVWNARLAHAESLIGEIENAAGFFNGDKAIPRFRLLNDSNNPDGYTAEAARTGDAGVYEEVRIGIFKGNDNECLGDVLVGVDSKGEPRVLLSSGGFGDEQSHAFYPMRNAEKAVERFDEIEIEESAQIGWVMDCSTSHVSRETMEILCNASGSNKFERTVAAYEHGCFISISPGRESDEQLPSDLRVVMEFARENSCGMLRLDADGASYRCLPEFDWEQEDVKLNKSRPRG